MDAVLPGEFDCVFQIVCDGHTTVGGAFESEQVVELSNFACGNDLSSKSSELLSDLKGSQRGRRYIEVIFLLLEEQQAELPEVLWGDASNRKTSLVGECG